MMPQPSTAPEPEGWDPEEEDHSPCPQDLGDEEYSAGPDAAVMEGAISKYVVCPFMYVLSFTCMNSVCTVIYLNELCMCKYMGLTYYCFQVSLPLW